MMALCFTLYGVAQAPVANAGNDKTICKDQSSYTISEATASDYTTITWTTSGSGSWGSPTTAGNVNSTYYPASGDKTAGFVNLTITAVKTGWVTPTTDLMKLSFANEPTANAGSNATICETGSFTVYDATAAYYSSVSWTTGGDGSFTNGTTLTPTYTPGVSDKIGVSVTLTLHSAATSPCVTEATDNMVLTLQNPPNAAAGSDATICNTSNSYTLAATASDYVTITWTTSGTGTWGSPGTSGNEDATYYPSTADKTAGTVTLTMTLVPNSPCVGNDTDDITLSIQSPPTADAGSDATICETDVPYTLAATATNNNAVAWSTSGTGTWGGTNNIEDATYYPSATDINNGSVTLTLLATHAYCTNDDDAMTLTFKKTPSAAAGNDATICKTAVPYTLSATASNYTTITWTTSGTGTWGAPSTSGNEDAVYHPSSADFTAGSVTLTMTLVNNPCDIEEDDMVLTFQAIPTVDAGADATTCEDTPYTLNADVTAGLYTAVTWTTSGNGTWNGTNDEIDATYYPGTTDADQDGIVILTLSAVPNTPCIVAIEDEMELSVADAPEVYAGADASICESGYVMDGNAEHELTTLWTTYGDGTFSDATELDATYYPGTNDKLGSPVKLTLVAAPIAPCTLLYSDDVYLDVTTFLPTVDAGDDDTGCDNVTYTFSDATVTNYENVLWVRLNADGTFTDPNVVNADYAFGPNDKANGFAVVKLVAQANLPCVALVEDEVTIYVQNHAEVAITATSATICEDDDYTLENVSVSYVQSVSWSTDGDGTFEFPDTYCKPTGGEFLGQDGFTYFGLGNISNSTGHASGGYAKYMNLSTALLADESYNLTWRCGYAVGALASMWIDLNMNGTFEDSERLITNASINTSNSSPSFTVPGSATPGEKRLRIRMRFQATGNNSSNPCNNFTYGETEDYTVFISDENGTVVLPTYHPGTGDISDKSINLCITGQPISPCVASDQDCMTLNIQLLPVAEAGAAETICEDQTYTVSDATAANYSTLTWTTSGDGTFSGNPLTITYEPGATDISGGSATLTLTLQPISPCTATDDDTMDLTIQLKPTVSVGSDQTVCEDICDNKAVQTCVDLVGTVGGGPNDGLKWTTTGTGTINDDTAEDTYYTPATADAGQTRTFTLTATSSTPCTGTVYASFTVFFQELPEIVTIGTLADATYCEDATAIPLDVTIGGGPYTSVLWTTDGLGEIDDASALSTTYAASADDGNETVTFTLTVTPTSPCTTTVDDEFSVYIQKLPVASPGGDQTICEGDNVSVDGSSSTDYNSLAVLWLTKLGDGTFADETAISTQYTPGSGDIVAGNVYLTLTVGPKDPCSTGDYDSLNVVIQLKPIAEAGSNATICADETYTVDDASAENYSAVSWTHDGDGDLTDDNGLTPTYDPGEGESGNVTLTLTAEPKDPCNASDDDFMVLTINPLPELTLVELQATKTSPVSWFDATGSLEGGYKLCIDGLAATNYNLDIDALTSSEDLEAGVYNEFFHTGTVPADFFDYWEAKGVVAGATGWQGVMWNIINGDLPIFYLLLDDGTKGFYDYKLIDGLKKQLPPYLDEPLTLPGDYPQGNYTFTGTVEDINGCVSEEVTIAIEFVHAPIISAGSDATIANNQSYTVYDASADHYTSITWSHNGDGDLTGDDGLTPTYDAAATDGGNTVTLTMFADANSPCVQAWDEMEITVKIAPTVTITTPASPWKYYVVDLTAEGTATDDGTVVLVEVNLDNTGWEDTGETGSWNFDYTSLAFGKHTLQARATDNEGYVSDIVSVDFYVHLQSIPLVTGWQLISSFLDPLAPTAVPTIMTGVVSNLVTMNTMNPTGVYSPAPFNINTIGNWNVMKGYKVKMKNPATLVISGDPVDNNSNVPFAAGFHYVPVLTDQLSEVGDIFDNPGDPYTYTIGDIMYITDLTNIYWPAGGLGSLGYQFTPGRAYYAQFINPVTVDFPDYEGYLVDEAIQPQVAPVGPWPCVRGEVAHIISIGQKALVDFEPGFIGAFNNNGQCIGFAEIADNENTGLIVFGDDSWTSEKDGAAEGDMISFRYYNNADQSEISLTAEYDITKPQYDGKFTENGLSMILSFYKASTGVSELEDASIQIYPNPAKDEITISYFGKDAVQQVSFTTVDGSIVRTQTLTGNLTKVDISDLVPGVYFVQFNTESGTRFTKLVVQ